MHARSALLGVLAVAAVASAGQADVVFQPILSVGQVPPGVDPGVTAAALAPQGLGDGGHIIVQVTLQGSGISTSNDIASYTGLPGSLVQWYRKSGPAGVLGGSGLIFPTGSGQTSGLTQPSSTGRFILNAKFAGAGVGTSNDSAVFLWDGSQLGVVFREGDPAPGYTDGTMLEDFGPAVVASLASDGRFLRQAATALYAGPTGAPAILLRSGDAAPGIPSAVLSSVSNWACSGGDKVIVSGQCEQDIGGVTSSDDAVLWTGTLSALSPLLREGGSIPGMHPGNRLDQMQNDGMSVNDAGEALFVARLLTGVGDTTSANDRVVLSGTSANFTVVAREGDQVPGLPVGVLYNSFESNVVSGNGVVAVLATVKGAGVTTGVNDRIVLTGTPAAPTVKLRSGDPAPGFPSGYTVGTLGNTVNVTFNRHGNYAVSAPVLNALGASAGRAIFTGAPVTGTPFLVAGSGSAIEVAPGDIRLVSESAGVSATPFLNLQNQVLFTAIFTDGSRTVFLASYPTSGPVFLSGGAATVADSTGNADGAADPGESAIGLTLPIRNAYPDAATGITATLTSFTPTATVHTSQAAYPDLAGGATAGNSVPFTLSLSPSHPCGAGVALQLTLTSAQGSNKVNILLPTGLAHPGCAGFALGVPVVVADSASNGNNNGIAEPGESAIAVTLPIVKTVGGGLSTGITSVLSSLSPTASIVSGASAYPDLAPNAGAPNSSPFILAIDPAHPCGTPVALRLTVSADGGLSTSAIDFSIPAGIPAAAATFALPGLAASIFDNAPAGTDVPFTVSGVNSPLTDVNFRFEGTSTTSSTTSTAPGLTHANVGDLVITLTSPSGISVRIVDRPGTAPGSTANNLSQLTLDDQSSGGSIQSIGNPAGAISGSFQPANPLSAFNGLTGSSVNGTWTLNVADVVASAGGVAGGQGGFVRSVSLTLSNAAVCVPPSAGTVENCCRGTTCNVVAAGSCTGSVAGGASISVGDCGSGASLVSCCHADFNHDGTPSIDDLFLYLNAYFTGSPWANVGGDGVAAPTIDDLFLYINAYFGGCA